MNFDNRTRDRHVRALRSRSVVLSHGFTLLELLLVMALLLIIAAAAVPNVGRTLSSNNLRTAAEQVRARWAKARVRAMETGRTYVFRFEPGGANFVVEPWMSQDDYLESSDLTVNGQSVSGNSPAGSAASSSLIAQDGKLPDGVFFLSSQVAIDVRGELLAESVSTTNLTDQATAGWSTPIYFYPDGTTSTAQAFVANDRNRAIEISLRGLTGIVKVGELTASPGVVSQ